MVPEGRLVRSAAALFMAGGVLILVTAWLPSGGSHDGNALDAIGLASVVVGGVAWLMPWERWTASASLVLVPIALGLACLADTGGRPPSTYDVYFVMVFAWVGLCHPPRTCLWLAPLAVPFGLLPALFDRGSWAGTLAAAVTAITVGLMVGETVAWAMAAARSAQSDAEHRARLLSAVVDATASVHALEPDQVLSDLVEAALSLGVDWAGLAVFSADGSSWKLMGQAGRSGPPASPLGGPHPALLGPPGLIRAHGRPLLWCAETDGGLAEPPFGPLGLRSLAAAPVRVGGCTAGVLMGGTTARPLAAEDLEALTLLADHAGWSLDNARRFRDERRARRRLAHISVRDELTGVGNRRHAAAVLESLVPGDAVMMVDLDHFKRVNDSEGHQAGDEVLRALADHLRSGVRDADTVARYGGEEFLVVLRGVGSAGVRTAQRLCSTWPPPAGRTTFSAGVAVHLPGEAPGATLARADAALYEAKRTGRDRVCYQEVVDLLEPVPGR